MLAHRIGVKIPTPGKLEVELSDGQVETFRGKTTERYYRQVTCDQNTRIVRCTGPEGACAVLEEFSGAGWRTLDVPDKPN